MGSLLGLLFHSLGGFASGSFYIPYRKIEVWSWESAWIVGGVFSWILVPFVAAYLTIPDFMQIIQQANSSTLFWTYAFGVLWGIGGLTFGLAMRYLGMSLGMSIALSLCSIFGALVPPIYREFSGMEGITFSQIAGSTGGRLVLLGIVVCIFGIYLCGKAGMMKENELSDEQKKESIKEFNLVKGLIVATISGLLSACFNFGIEAGKLMANEAIVKGCDPLFQNNVIFIVVLWGGFTTNFIWCMYLNYSNKSFGDYLNTNSPLRRNYTFAAVAGTTWFLQFFFYGMGESKLGNGASSWILHMATIILTSNFWGLYFKEWKGVSKQTLRTVMAGIVVILVSVIIVGIGNSL
ncbi:L-rhamnose/proton symporter RhaT [Aquirufa ecclesiirivi]|uniref:L-rhamnose/proton symporter RhaT n=1 Tax=Aquirufa ecclesiirivi TaxID=2715124 RepID=A0ABT4JCT8_9BACT|nr:L-rhamnose/proton symporter RhaT [Aquirufa ecclesiirivi]MCZ2472226.1 L-rhamnose/proton symporter RhaT [Aquirufa ecclesiirivi]MCZ2474096.1 L-rhamnose/proton symporter RhaT [Aquirufa ecclesiirivi]MDF0693934.1 L-rhamnose/proton symporter RhaT [Aquirufa ecclesiirivi]NHC48612.1 L-rhamnose/proton symporter RhaT [Aquirufa ecclesiirivi]